MLSLPLLALTLATFLVGGLVKGALGLGLPVIVLAVLAPTLGLKTALAVFLLPAILSNIWQALTGPALRELLARLWPFLGAAVLGIWIGTGVLASAETRWLEAMLGGLLIAYAAVALLTPQIPPPGRHERWMSPAAGGLAGALFGVTGLFIVPGILYLQALGLRRDVFVQALGLTFVTISISLGAGMASRALLTVETAQLSALAVVPTFLGLAIGKRLRGKVSEGQFRKLFFFGLFLVGTYMIATALAPPF